MFYFYFDKLVHSTSVYKRLYMCICVYVCENTGRVCRLQRLEANAYYSLLPPALIAQGAILLMGFFVALRNRLDVTNFRSWQRK